MQAALAKAKATVQVPAEVAEMIVTASPEELTSLTENAQQLVEQLTDADAAVDAELVPDLHSPGGRKA